MIYIKLDNNNEEISTHYQPFDEMNGLRKSREELEKEGVLVEELPIREEREGFSSKLKYNPDKQELFYIYTELEKTPEQLQKEKISILEQRTKAAEDMLLQLMMEGTM